MPRGNRKAAAEAQPASAAKTKPKAAATAPLNPTAKPRSKPARRGSSAKVKPGARGRTAAAPGQGEQTVLRLVRERPGVTVAELAQELGVDSTGLYGVVRRLQDKGQMSKDRTQLRLSDAATAAGAAASDAASQPAGLADASVPAGENSTPSAAEPACASATADEAS